MSFTLETFGNEKYQMLKLLCEQQVQVKDAVYVTLSQQELADIAHISKYKANQFINELINEDCVCLYQNKRGKYKLTDKGTKIVQEMQRKRN